MRMENLKSTLAVLMALILCLASLGCGPGTTSSLITALNVVSDAANVAVVLTSSLAAAGKLDPAVAAEVSAYATGIGTAVNTAVSELGRLCSSELLRISLIVSCFLFPSQIRGCSRSILLQSCIQHHHFTVITDLSFFKDTHSFVSAIFLIELFFHTLKRNP